MTSKIIPIEQAIEMKNEYHSHVKTSIENQRGTGYQATEFAWIDLATLKSYVQLLESVESTNNQSVSGVRIYFSAYPNSPTFGSNRSLNVALPARETFFMVPTLQVESTALSQQYGNLEHLPFCINPTNASNQYKGDFLVISDLLNSHDNPSAITETNYQGKTSLVMNDLQLTPPPR